MGADLPPTSHIKLERHGPVLWLWLNRPDARNALSAQMVDEICATFDCIRDDRTVRVVVIRGMGGTFSAGGDIKTMQASLAAPDAGAPDALKASNRRYGSMLQMIDEAPQVVVAAVEGVAMGGGIGFASVADITITTVAAQFAMTEVTLGVVPAAISPFVVRRIGLAAARRLGVTGAKLDGHGAKAVGLADDVVADGAALDTAISAVVAQALRCAPEAVAETKRLMQRAASGLTMPELLDRAAESFVQSVRGAEGQEGTRAFVEKRRPSWAEKTTP